jgi:hypothetical protein
LPVFSWTRETSLLYETCDAHFVCDFEPQRGDASSEQEQQQQQKPHHRRPDATAAVEAETHKTHPPTHAAYASRGKRRRGQRQALRKLTGMHGG